MCFGSLVISWTQHPSSGREMVRRAFDVAYRVGDLAFVGYSCHTSIMALTVTNMRAVIQQSGKTATVNFVDQQGKKLVAKLPAPLDKGAIVVLSGKDHHGDQFNARYVIK